MKPNAFRPQFEFELYDNLLRNSFYKKISEEQLNKVSLAHQQEQTFAFLTNGILINSMNSPALFAAFEIAKRKLKISNRVKIDLYIENNPEINAGIAFLGDKKYAIYLNSGLINLLNIEELKFVIGHELGHFKYKHHKIIKKSTKKILPSLLLRLYEHSRYAEIAADRCGLIACSSSKTAKSSLLKIATGSDLKYFNSDVTEYKNQIKEIKKLLSNDNSLINEKLSHPYSLIRIYAIEVFEKAFFKKTSDNISEFEQVDKKILSLLSVLNPKPNNYKNKLTIYASFWVSYSHIKNLTIEKENIENISDPVILNKILKESKNMPDKERFFKDSFVRNIKKGNNLSLSDKSDILDRICSVAACDGQIQTKENDVIYKISNLLDLKENYVKSVIRKFE